MKALVCEDYGSLDCVVYREVPDPEVGPHDVLIGMRAAGVVYTDALFAFGKYQVRPPLPFRLGSELSGEVLAVGREVTRFRPGDRVATLSMTFGAFSEKVAVPAWLPARLPDGASYDLGAALMSATATAQHALRQGADLRLGETLVVTGAAGGTGSAAIQVGKAIGARVIAVVSSAERVAFCLRLGADEAIDYSREELKQAIRDRTGGRGADVVLETVGGEVFDACARAMAMEGRLLAVGFASGQLPVLPVNLALVKLYSLIGVHWLNYIVRHPDVHQSNMGELMDWVERGLVRPEITTVLPLRDGAEAMRRLYERRAMGKIILKP